MVLICRPITHVSIRSPIRLLRHCASIATNKGNLVPLNIALVMGSTRVGGPPFPSPLGERIGVFIASELRSRGHNVTIVDPREEQLDLLQKAHFAYRKVDLPSQLKSMANVFVNADAYVMCSPEYNHAPSPALLNILVSAVHKRISYSCPPIHYT